MKLRVTFVFYFMHSKGRLKKCAAYSPQLVMGHEYWQQSVVLYDWLNGTGPPHPSVLLQCHLAKWLSTVTQDSVKKIMPIVTMVVLQTRFYISCIQPLMKHTYLQITMATFRYYFKITIQIASRDTNAVCIINCFSTLPFLHTRQNQIISLLECRSLKLPCP